MFFVGDMADDKGNASAGPKTKAKRYGARISFTKCIRCGKRFKKGETGDQPVCPECNDHKWKFIQDVQKNPGLNPQNKNQYQ